MSVAREEADLIAARRLRNVARGIVRTDLKTLRRDLTERPLVQHMRDMVVATAVDTAEDGIALARENLLVLALTLAGIIGWLFREPLGALAHSLFREIKRRISQWRR